MHEKTVRVNPRLLVDGRVLLDPAGGGVYEYASRLTEALRVSGKFSVEVWANSARAAKTEGVDRQTRHSNKLLNASMRFVGRPEIESLSGSAPDLLWLPNPNFAAFKSATPLALTVHDASFEIYPEFFSLKQRWWHRAVDPRNLARRASVVLAVSETTKRDVVDRWGLAPERVAVTYEGAAPEFFDPPPLESLAELKQRRRLPGRFILHFGAMEPRKNHLSLLAAYHLLRPQDRFAGLGLVLAGPPGWNNAEILSAIRRSPYRDDIRMLGFVTPAERRGLYRAASVLAFPSYYEGFGLPPLEAMASGLPVVASHAGATSEIVGDAGILTDPYRPSELADALAAVLDSPSLSALYAGRGKARARKFTWDACAAKTEQAFAGILSPSFASPQPQAGNRKP